MAASLDSGPAETPVDVDALLDEIRRRLHEARPDEEAIEGSASPTPHAPTLPDEALARAVELVRRAPTTAPDLRFPGHRSGASGALVRALKRAAAAVVLLPMRQQLERQARREAADVTLADEIYKRLVGMEADLRERLDRVEARQVMELEGLRRRLAAVEAAVEAPAPGAGADRS